MNKYLIFFCFLVLVPIAALAADAAAPTAPTVQDTAWTTVDYLRAALSGAFGGLISGLVALVIGRMNNKNALKLNQQKIDADKKNLELQLEQKEKELKAQFKMQTEKLHSDDIKRVCNDFLSCTNPMLFSKDLFDFDTMVRCTSPLYLYCNEEYFSYFENVALFIARRNLSRFGKQYTFICESIATKNNEIRHIKSEQTSTQGTSSKLDLPCHELEELEKREFFLEDMLEAYSTHHKLALDAAKKLIWGKPITKAEPLNLPELYEEDEL